MYFLHNRKFYKHLTVFCQKIRKIGYDNSAYFLKK